jgi:carbon storage regulator CsrA
MDRVIAYFQGWRHIMLVQTRYAHEWIQVGPDIYIMVVRIDGNKVRIGIEAPDDVKILRGELTGKPFPAQIDQKNG